MEKIKFRELNMVRKRILRLSGIIFVMIVILSNAVSDVIAQDKEVVVAMVERINGSLDFRENSESDWKKAKVKEALYNGYQLRTQTGDKAVIMYMASGSRVLINENTELEVQAQKKSAGTKPTGERTKLMIGEIYSKVRKGNNFDVETPTSVASVRGTEFDSIFEDGEATFVVVDQVVEVMNQLGSVLLAQLQTISVGTGDTPSEGDVKNMTKDDVGKVVSWTDGVEPTWKLNMVPEKGTTQEIGTSFALTIWAQDPETGSIDANATLALSAFEVSPDILEFSADNGRTWTNAPQVTLTNGTARLLARPTAEGSVSISIQAPNTEPASVSITVNKVKEKMIIELIYTKPDGSGEKTIRLELEEK
ncbi:MAG: FecR domain-containing protein [Candidatus Latescibacteria bacterium]|nr:FecR domain-containing protein [Candidatus Latescibacterota bacterium]